MILVHNLMHRDLVIIPCSKSSTMKDIKDIENSV